MAKKEFKIGEEFQCGLVKLICDEGGDCSKCFFDGVNYCCTVVSDIVGPCDSRDREDKTSVVFVKVKELETV